MNDNCQMCGGSHEPGADCDRATREAVQKSSDLIRALRVVALSNEERIKAVLRKDADVLWFLEHVDDLAPELLRRGWIEHKQFAHQRGCVVVTDGQGDLRRVEITELGRGQFNVAVLQ